MPPANEDEPTAPPEHGADDTSAEEGLYGLTDWSPPGRVIRVYDMTSPDDWERLVTRYVHAEYDDPLQRIFEIARLHNVRSVVVEFRYIDADWRSQVARFFNGTFRRFPSVCHRLHFFTSHISRDLTELDGAADAYRGYTVLRPYPLAPVGRTMISPPPELSDAVRCESIETIELAGREFDVRSMPFISQDFQFLRCAHAAIWMVLAHCRLTHGLGRQLPEQIHDAGIVGERVGRSLPSEGLSGPQILAALDGLGLSPGRRILPETREAEEDAGPLRLYTIMRRYINSSLPPIVTSRRHAWVVVAYSAVPSDGDSSLTLWRHDDSLGPYLRVENPWDEQRVAHRPWQSAFLPLLPKAYVDAERAAAIARVWVAGFATTPYATGSTLEAANDREDDADRPTVRTYLIRSSQFKTQLTQRGVPPEIVAAYRYAPMSRLIWVVEIVDRQKRRAGEPDVIGEIILDATLAMSDPIDDPTAGVLAAHIDHTTIITGVDGATPRMLATPSGQYYTSGCPAIPANQQ